LAELGAVPGTLILYESPYRVVKLLEELADLYPERRVALARELTKKFEELRVGKPAELLEMVKKRAIKGEFVVLMAPKPL
jgi:16S rRNA (cytidine1402-2'-O)-methyltransferase